MALLPVILVRGRLPASPFTLRGSFRRRRFLEATSLRGSRGEAESQKAIHLFLNGTLIQKGNVCKNFEKAKQKKWRAKGIMVDWA